MATNHEVPGSNPGGQVFSFIISKAFCNYCNLKFIGNCSERTLVLQNSFVHNRISVPTELMTSYNPTSNQIVTGSVRKILFQNIENGFSVFRVLADNRHDQLITVTGIVHSLFLGEHVNCVGEWSQDKKYGLQFRATKILLGPPASNQDTELFLSNGAINGVGRRMARKLSSFYGDNLFQIINTDPEMLLEIPKFTHHRLMTVLSSWIEKNREYETTNFLFSIGLTDIQAFELTKKMKVDIEKTIRENPFILSSLIKGLTFSDIDTIAKSFGIADSAEGRIQAGIRYALNDLLMQGHCAYEKPKFIAKITRELNVTPEVVEFAITQEVENKYIVEDKLGRTILVYRRDLYEDEVTAAKQLLRLNSKRSSLDCASAYLFNENDRHTKIFSDEQLNAVKLALRKKLCVITGGPGVGKTTLVKRVIEIARKLNLRTALGAPTGKAAKRLSDSTGEDAKTLHRLLEYDPQNARFVRCAENPLDAQLVVVDESSMIDISLLRHLVSAISDDCNLLLVGDSDQLPSVGPGNILSDIINSSIVPTYRLNEVFRQAKRSKIVQSAHLINRGKVPNLVHPSDELTDFYFIKSDTTSDIKNNILRLVCERIPKRFGLDPMTEIQVLTPMNKGELGSNELNYALKEELNKSHGVSIKWGRFTYSVGDKIIQTVNDYENCVFNGETGIISSIIPIEGEIQILFEQREVKYKFDRLNQILPGYALSIHKSQGSEYPAVVIPISELNSVMLQRNLIYTGITRAKRLAILVGQKNVFELAIKNEVTRHRVTGLTARLNLNNK